MGAGIQSKLSLTIEKAADGARIAFSAPIPSGLSKPLLSVRHPETSYYWSDTGWSPKRFSWPAIELDNGTTEFLLNNAPTGSDLPSSRLLSFEVPAALIKHVAQWPEEPPSVEASPVTSEPTLEPVVLSTIPDTDEDKASLSELPDKLAPLADTESREPPTTQIPRFSVRLIALVAGLIVLAVGATTLINHKRLESFEASLETRHVHLSQREDATLGREQRLAEQMAALASDQASFEQVRRQVALREQAANELQARLTSQEAMLRQREQELERQRQNAGPEIARVTQLLGTLRAEREELDRLQRTIAVERSTVQQQRQSNELASANLATAERNLGDRRATLATQEAAIRQQRQSNELASANLATTRQELESARRALAVDQSEHTRRQQALSTAESNLAERVRAVGDREQTAIRIETEFRQRSSELEQRRNEVVSEWNAILSRAPGNVFHAYAIDSGGSVWWSVRRNSTRTARQDVQQRCEAETRVGNCRTVDFSRSQCAAVARSPGGGWGFAVGSTRSEAGASAVGSCRQHGNSACTITSDGVWCGD
jgi:hypothetical protein